MRPRLLDLLPHSVARRSIDALLALLLAALPLAASAAPPSFILPLACAPNRDCWIANHVDLDPGPGIRDHACGAPSYDGHSGTYFAILDLAAMAEGIAVLAAATCSRRSHFRKFDVSTLPNPRGKDGRFRENAPQWRAYSENSELQYVVEYEIVPCPVTVCGVVAN